MAWWYQQGSRIIGPLSDHELLRRATGGEVTGQTPVRKAGMLDWRPYAEVASQVQDGPTADTVSPPAPSGQPQRNSARRISSKRRALSWYRFLMVGAAASIVEAIIDQIFSLPSSATFPLWLVLLGTGLAVWVKIDHRRESR